jgi:hypothetical protein
MKCLRCGYCCINYFVPIVDDPDRGLDPDNIIIHKGDGKPCKHLQGDEPGEYSCAVHGKPWYCETPCYDHGQIESNPDSPCRVGEHLLKKVKK